MKPFASPRMGLAVLGLMLAACGGVHPIGMDDAGGDDATTTSDLGAIDGSHATDLGATDATMAADGPMMVVDAGDVDASDVDAAPDPVPPFRDPLTTADDVLARQALAILGAPEAGATSPSCRTCHSITRARIRYWRALSDTAMSTCLTDLGVSSDASATAMLTCLRDPATSRYSAPRLGIWATAATLPWFQYVFRHGTFPTSAWMTVHSAFVTQAGMPRSGTPLSMADFDIVAEWFLRGVPNLDAVLPVGAAPTSCLPGVSSDATAHIAEMATTGWAARNAAAGMLMEGCAGATTAAGCLTSYPLASSTAYGTAWDTIGDGVAGAHLRIAYTTTYETSWWTRTSPDGRFVGSGAAVAPNMRFVDLRGTPRVFGADGLYDVSFFPDNSGFVIQGSSHGTRVCQNTVLSTGMPTMLTFTEVGCSSGTGIGLYEHLGTSLDGSDYWAISGTATYDNGGHSPTLTDPIADFPASASTTFTRLVNTGTGFTLGAVTHLAHAYEGDAVISPSLGVLLTRQAGASAQEGYVLHRLDVTTTPTFTVSAPEIGRYCISGGKPEFSYDEHWMVIHHYIGDADAVELGFTGPTDPGFATYRTLGAANVYLVNLATGAHYRVTNMAPGQYALFPHFRSDGWIYFMVRDESLTPEHVVVSDAALLAAP